MLNRLLSTLFVATLVIATATAQEKIHLKHLKTINVGGLASAEIAAYDAKNKTIWVLNNPLLRITQFGVSNIQTPVKLGSVDISKFGGGINSVAVHDSIVALAIEGTVKTDSGAIVLLNSNTRKVIRKFTVSALPDMVTFTNDGKKVLAACEGEPSSDYTIDPEGGVAIIDLTQGISSAKVKMLGFTTYNNTTIGNAFKKASPASSSIAQDIEPEYIAVSKDNQFAWVGLQENNALAKIDLTADTLVMVKGLGYKDHSLLQNALDASDKGSVANITTWQVRGLYMPDAISAFQVNGTNYFVSANEGDARDYSAYSEEKRVKDLTLDATIFPNAATLKSDNNLGRLKCTNAIGDTDGDGDFDEIYTYGARSFSIWDANGNLVYDSGDDFEQILLDRYPTKFNGDSPSYSFKARSDDKGPEPEAAVTGVINGRTYAFIGLERAGGVMVYDITNPMLPVFNQYINTDNYSGGGDISPESISFIPAATSPNGENLLMVSYELSGTVTFFQVNNECEVAFTNANANVAVTGNNIAKTSGTNGWGNGDAAGSEALSGKKKNGWLEVTVPQTNKKLAFGFSNNTVNKGFISMSFAVLLNNNATYDVLYKGTSVGVTGIYAASDVFRVNVINNEVYIYKNDDQVHKFTQVPTAISIYPDFSFFSVGAGLTDVSTSFGSCVGGAARLETVNELIENNDLESVFDARNVLVYPNPADEMITLDLTTFGGNVETVSIFNALGSMVKTVRTNGETIIDINIGELPAGMFVVRVNNQVSIKWIKK